MEIDGASPSNGAKKRSLCVDVPDTGTPIIPDMGIAEVMRWVTLPPVPAPVPAPFPDFTGTFWYSLPLPCSGSSLAQAMGVALSLHDLLDDPAVVPDPIETKPHLTLLQGVPAVERECLRQMPGERPNVAFDSLGFFSNDKVFASDGKRHAWDVLYVKPTADTVKALKVLQDKLAALHGLKWHFDEYKPHVTLAYLKHGCAAKYVKPLPGNQALQCRCRSVWLQAHRDDKVEKRVLEFARASLW